MKLFASVVLIASWICSINAGECLVHNRPDYLSIANDKSGRNSDGSTVSTFAANLATLLGLSSEQTEKQEQPIFYSSRALDIPSSTWLFHVEGLDRLFNKGIPLKDNQDFDINAIGSKLTKLGEHHAMSSATINIASSSDIDNLEQTLKDKLSQMDKQASIHYLVIVCDECGTDRAIQQLKKQLQSSIDQIITGDSKALTITLATKETARVRRARQAADGTNNVTIATMYSDEYPTMFNLFFWTSLMFAIIVISIVYVFLTLDPGSDTIIYRLTAPRLKAD